MSDLKMISTTKLCNWLEMHVSVNDVIELTGILPVFRTSTGVFWDEDDVSFIAVGLAQHFLNISVTAQRYKGLNK